MEKYKQIEQLKQQLRKTRENGDFEREWFIKHAPSQTTRQFIQNQKHVTHSELQILSELTYNDTATPFKKLQSMSPLSQGMLSRYVNRLTAQTLVEKYHPIDNKKEIFLRLTKIGYELGMLHLTLHQTIRIQEERILSDYSDDDVTNLVQLATKLLDARKTL